MLLLFDIDLTLVRTNGAGLKALCEAGRAAFGVEMDASAVDFAGRLDPIIVHDLLVTNGVEPTASHERSLRRAYFDQLPRFLEGQAEALPGTRRLIDALAGISGMTLGILTGNFEPSGRMKLGSAGFDPDRFEIRVWGDDSPHEPPSRDDLPAVALERFEEARGRPPRGCSIIGDTRHDVACALANGCRALAVATGRTPPDELRDAGAHLVVGDLTDTDRIVAWLLHGGRVGQL